MPTSTLPQIEAAEVDPLIEQLRGPLGCDQYRDIYQSRHAALKDVVSAWDRLAPDATEWHAVSALLEPNEYFEPFAQAAARLLYAADIVMEGREQIDADSIDYSVVVRMERAYAGLGRLIEQWKETIA
jgi:hypothetical protein